MSNENKIVGFFDIESNPNTTTGIQSMENKFPGVTTNTIPTSSVTNLNTFIEDVNSGLIGGIRGWSNNLSWSSSAYNSITYGSGTLTLSNGSSYSITGDTKTLTTITYIFLDTAVSNTTLQTTTTASASVGPTRILVAVANITVSGKKAEFQVFGGNGTSVLITADNIAAGTITANEIATNSITSNNILTGTITTSKLNFTPVQPSTGANTVNSSGYMTSIDADSITSGTITGRTIQTASGTGARIELTSASGLRSFDSGNNVRLRMPTDGTGMTFFNSSGSSTGRLQGYTPSSGTFSGVDFVNIDNNGTSGDGNLLVDNKLLSGGDTYLSVLGTSYTTYCSGKLKIPVGSNLY